MNKHSKGFTLIELMIVVSIVAILAATAIPLYTDQTRKARRTDAMDALLDCAAAQARNYTTASPPTYLDQPEAVAAGICNNMNSKEGFYTLTIANPGCGGAGGRWCFVLTATPTAGGLQANDTECVSMAVDHRSNKFALDEDGDDAAALCWRTS